MRDNSNLINNTVFTKAGLSCDTDVEEIKFFLLCCGLTNIEVQENSDLEIYQQKKFLFIIPLVDTDSIKLSWIKKQIISSEIQENTSTHKLNLNKFYNHFMENRSNSFYFRHLRSEYNNYFIETEKGNHFTASIFVYRALEYISYLFPILYFSKAKNIKGSFEIIKNYFENKKSELKFLEIINETFINSAYLNIESKISKSTLDSEQIKTLRSVLREFGATEDDYYFNFSNKQIFPIVITLRNKTLHFLLNRSDTLHSDKYHFNNIFKEINLLGINWISLIYFEFLRDRIR